MTGTDDTICYALPNIKIDTDRLLADYRRLENESWINQNRYADITNWKGVALYSINGETNDLRCADRSIVKKTPAGEKCDYICNELLPQFGAPLLRVALYRLTAGTKVGRHKDYGQNRTMGMIRIHIPIVTNKQVIMTLEEQKYFFDVGEAWYFDASCWHSVNNDGDEDRIHLIADFAPSEQLNDHLKTITSKDRLRFARARMEHTWMTMRAFGQFMGSKEGRSRIRARLGVLMGKSQA